MTARRYGVLLALTVLATAGCSAGDAQPATTPPPPAAAPTTVAPPADHHHHGADPSGSVGPRRAGAPTGRIVVHAADALRRTFTELAPRFEAAYPGTTVVLDFGTSASHAGHIVDGAAVDVFASADPAATGRVTKAGRSRGRPRPIVLDPLVVAVTAANPAGVKGVADLARPGVRLAVCAEQAPCGSIARRVLAASGVGVQPAVVAPDASTALAGLTSGAADAALVQRTDVLTAGGGLRPLDIAQATLIADEYTVTTVRSGRNRVGGEAFAAFISSALARRVFADAGFSIP
jgi:molybdate transport system substrate-binding protein